MKTINIDGVEYVERGAELPVMDAVTAPYQIGENYFIRTITMYYTGKIVWVGEHEIVLESPAWIADTERFADVIASGALKEVEPMGKTAIIGRGAIVDACTIEWTLPTEQK